MKRTKLKILKQKTTLSNVKNLTKCAFDRRASKLKDGSIKITQSEEQRGRKKEQYPTRQYQKFSVGVGRKSKRVKGVRNGDGRT